MDTGTRPSFERCLNYGVGTLLALYWGSSDEKSYVSLQLRRTWEGRSDKLRSALATETSSNSQIARRTCLPAMLRARVLRTALLYWRVKSQVEVLCMMAKKPIPSAQCMQRSISCQWPLREAAPTILHDQPRSSGKKSKRRAEHIGQFPIIRARLATARRCDCMTLARPALMEQTKRSFDAALTPRGSRASRQHP